MASPRPIQPNQYSYEEQYQPVPVEEIQKAKVLRTSFRPADQSLPSGSIDAKLIEEQPEGQDTRDNQGEVEIADYFSEPTVRYNKEITKLDTEEIPMVKTRNPNLTEAGEHLSFGSKTDPKTKRDWGKNQMHRTKSVPRDPR